jgi:hypothetical protein
VKYDGQDVRSIRYHKLLANSLSLKTSWPVAATMPIEVMEEFAREGWIGLGWQIGRDSMHFQPTR